MAKKSNTELDIFFAPSALFKSSVPAAGEVKLVVDDVDEPPPPPHPVKSKVLNPAARINFEVTVFVMGVSTRLVRLNIKADLTLSPNRHYFKSLFFVVKVANPNVELTLQKYTFPDANYQRRSLFARQT
jgi:hypothetical protein